MRNLRIISSHFSRVLKSIETHPSSNHLFSIQSRSYSSPATQSENVSKIVNELSNLTLLETMDLTEILRQKLDISELPVMAAMMPGMSFPGSGAGKSTGGEGKEKKKEAKTAFDVMLQAYEAVSKIKVIKEVRTITDLGLKEAKDLVEKAPTLLKKGVSKEEAEKIIEKLKAVGAKVAME
ncbi:unnamed protein product [Arabidopsis lyrata]|uniref:Ribosomal protein L12 family protein n=1 Tax=Arabidopsis lyrata subsp. lyrata TaxID=81972 RepID=D7MBI0_ARALL|nr:uncharacterized protein LOC9303089 [Arabidopsis lyrata subsp. lyrata]XP_020874730.1 uncharacterized protein LOC9303089 [Arabidopsis lyrata subsp. lyrata]EFH43276.1 ribosomal protein L12 family protein [Arabidopsis lyrata subsp. lyrata]CAH8274138.1 unnamed protein product [Arabidopsis lyrata]|eukprot:XP_002867017.1 uncharacterized protein LOC9303089 [Arabidopsis lyrata subsp. lyrata]